jgi:hypothetical protein
MRPPSKAGASKGLAQETRQRIRAVVTAKRAAELTHRLNGHGAGPQPLLSIPQAAEIYARLCAYQAADQTACRTRESCALGRAAHRRCASRPSGGRLSSKVVSMARRGMHWGRPARGRAGAQGSAPPLATQGRTHSHPTRRRHAKAAHRARLSPAGASR